MQQTFDERERETENDLSLKRVLLYHKKPTEKKNEVLASPFNL